MMNADNIQKYKCLLAYRLKTQELKNIRRLAHEVLLQRSDVETFLVSSLKQVPHLAKIPSSHKCCSLLHRSQKLCV